MTVPLKNRYIGKQKNSEECDHSLFCKLVWVTQIGSYVIFDVSLKCKISVI